MRAIHAFPLLAALALAACGEDNDVPAIDQALSANDVDQVISDNGTMPQPGEYSTRVSLVGLDAPGMTEASIAEMRSEFEDGAAYPHLFCVTEETTREQWLSDMTEADCTLSRFAADGTQLNGVMMCSSEESFDGPVDISGRAQEAISNLSMTYVFPTAAGEGTVQMQVVAEKIGACGG